MRILHIISTLDPAAGGPSESVRVLMGFHDIGYVGEAVTLDDPSAPFLQTLSFPVHALGPARSTFGYSPTMFKWVKANAHRFDGVIVNGLWNFCGVIAWRALPPSTRYMVFSHGMLDPYFKRAFPLKHAKKWPYWLAAQYWVLRKAFRVLFTTSEESQLAKQSFWLHKWKSYVVPYGSSRPPAEISAAGDCFYRSLPEVRDRRFLLFLGRIHRKKGCDLLLKSFARYAADDPGLDLVMAGPDGQGWSSELKELIAHAGLAARVHWPGMLKGDVKWGAFHASEAFILPSHQENFGIAVAEALACGRAVLLTDKVNIAPQIAIDGAGLMQPDTQEGIDALLEQWIATSEERRQTMQAQALVTFTSRYDMQSTAESIIRLFEEAKQLDGTRG